MFLATTLLIGYINFVWWAPSACARHPCAALAEVNMLPSGHKSSADMRTRSSEGADSQSSKM